MVVYKSTDASAPTLQGIVGGAVSSHNWADGSLLQVLRKCLVTGYGSGAQASGAGWTQPYEGTSKGVFKQGAGCGFYLRVLDDGSATAGAKEGIIRGFETMSDVDTGLQAFPTTGQQATGLFVRKSDTADTTTRPWIVFADSKTFYMFVQTGLVATVYTAGWMFGDFHSLRSGDAYNCAIIARASSSSIDTPANDKLDILGAQSGALSAQTANYIARGYNQQGGSVNCGKQGGMFLAPASTTQPVGGSSTGLIFPNPTDGLFYVSRVYITDASTNPSTSLRGWLRGFYSSQHDGSKVPFDFTMSGTGTLAGKTLWILGSQSGNSGRYCMESSDTWD